MYCIIRVIFFQTIIRIIIIIAKLLTLPIDLGFFKFTTKTFYRLLVLIINLIIIISQNLNII